MAMFFPFKGSKALTDPTQYYPLGIYKDWVYLICDLERAPSKKYERAVV
jgi:hypothetical protein